MLSVRFVKTNTNLLAVCWGRRFAAPIRIAVNSSRWRKFRGPTRLCIKFSEGGEAPGGREKPPPPPNPARAGRAPGFDAAPAGDLAAEPAAPVGSAAPPPPVRRREPGGPPPQPTT